MFVNVIFVRKATREVFVRGYFPVVFCSVLNRERGELSFLFSFRVCFIYVPLRCVCGHAFTCGNLAGKLQVRCGGGGDKQQRYCRSQNTVCSNTYSHPFKGGAGEKKVANKQKNFTSVPRRKFSLCRGIKTKLMVMFHGTLVSRHGRYKFRLFMLDFRCRDGLWTE